MSIAKNFAEYQAQVSRLEVPAFNITYADKTRPRARELTMRTLSSLRMLSRDEKLSFAKMAEKRHDQLPLPSQKKLRVAWRTRKDVF